jgi:dTMP kinase
VFVTFEGIEGSGKSTQAKLLFEELLKRGFTVTLTREPGGTPAAEEIRNVLLTEKQEKFPPIAEVFLYEAARAFHVENLIKPALERGSVVICDRFTDSTLAYQGFGRGISLEFLKELNEKATGGIKPDLTFLLDLPVEEAFKRLRRKNLDRIESESLSFHKRVREGFLSIAEEEPERIVVIDATLDVNSIFETVLSEFLRRVNAS